MDNFSAGAAKVLAYVGFYFLVLVIAFGLSALLAYPVKWIINYLFTPGVLLALFGVAKMTFWRAFWLSYLCSVLFKSSYSSSK